MTGDRQEISASSRDPARRVDQLAERIVANAALHTASLRKLARLRLANHAIQDAFHSLEAHLTADTVRLETILADDRHLNAPGLALRWGGSGISQLLPVASAGICALALHAGDIRSDENAVLHVHLVAAEDQCVVDRWTIPVERLKPGWVVLSLSRTLVGAPHTLELRLNLEGGEAASLSVSRGQLQPLASFQARDGGGKLFAGPHGLALRVWSGAIESTPGLGASYFVADARGPGRAGRVWMPLAPQLVARAVHANIDESGSEFVAVLPVHNQIAFQCHPPAEGMTIAQVSLPHAVWPLAVSADAEIRNSKSRPVEFALVLAESLERARQILARSDPLPNEGFSGWIKAASDCSSSLSASLERPGRRRSKLFCATRMEEAGNNFFAWARFRRVQLEAHAS